MKINNFKRKFGKNLTSKLVAVSAVALMGVLAFQVPVQNAFTSAYASVTWTPKIDAQSIQAQGILVTPTEGAVKNNQTGTALNFSKNQLILKINDGTQLQTILDAFEFKLIDDGKIPEAPNGLVKQIRKLADFPYYVVEITNQNNANLQRYLKNRNVNGFTFDSKESAVTFALSRSLNISGVDGVYLNQTADLTPQRIIVNPTVPQPPTNPIDNIGPINDFVDTASPIYQTEEWKNSISEWEKGNINDEQLQKIDRFLQNFWKSFVNEVNNANLYLEGNTQILINDFNNSLNKFLNSVNTSELQTMLNNTAYNLNNLLHDFLYGIQNPIFTAPVTPVIPTVPVLVTEPAPVVPTVPVNPTVPTTPAVPVTPVVPTTPVTETYGDANFVEKYVLPESKNINEAIGKTDLVKNQTAVAVIDYGFDLKNYDLTGENAVNKDYKNTQITPIGYDFGCKNYLQKGSVTKDATHGTEIAATILGAGGNDFGVTGVAKNSQLIALRAGAGCDSSELHIWNVIKSIRTANAWGADVINMSFGFNSEITPSVNLLQNVVKEAQNNGIVLVAAAGNNGHLDSKNNEGVMYPANLDGVIAVGGATGKDGRIIKTDWSNYGKYIQVWADGTVPVTPTEEKNANCYTLKYGCSRFNTSNDQGTSFSAAIVSGVVATLKQIDPKIDAAKAVAQIMNSGRAVEGESGKFVSLTGAVKENLKVNGNVVTVSNQNPTNTIMTTDSKNYGISLFEF